MSEEWYPAMPGKYTLRVEFDPDPEKVGARIGLLGMFDVVGWRYSYPLFVVPPYGRLMDLGDLIREHGTLKATLEVQR